MTTDFESIMNEIKHHLVECITPILFVKDVMNNLGTVKQEYERAKAKFKQITLPVKWGHDRMFDVAFRESVYKRFNQDNTLAVLESCRLVKPIDLDERDLMRDVLMKEIPELVDAKLRETFRKGR